MVDTSWMNCHDSDRTHARDSGVTSHHQRPDDSSPAPARGSSRGRVDGFILLTSAGNMMGRRSAKRGPTQQRRGQVDLLLDVSAKLESLNSEIRTAAARMGAPEHARQLTGPRVRKGVQHAGFNLELMCVLCDAIQWPDTKLVYNMAFGFPVTGNLEDSAWCLQTHTPHICCGRDARHAQRPEIEQSGLDPED
jgi:hypothetical protein